MSVDPKSRLRAFFAPTQYIRIFVIVNLTTFFLTKTFLDTRARSHYREAVVERERLFREHNLPLPRDRSHLTIVPYQKREERKSNRQSIPIPSAARQKRLPSSSSSSSLTDSSLSISSSPEENDTMAPRGKGENTKKAAGNAKKAEVAAAKQAVTDRQREAEEDTKWSQGSKKPSAKKETEAEKKAEAAAKKAERDRLLSEEESMQRDKPKGAGKKTAEKKNVGKPSMGTLNLDDLDSQPAGGKVTALNASGIDNALDALSLANTGGNDMMKLDRHPERRFKAAYRAYEERRLPEIEVEHPGLRKQQRIEIVKKEFEKSDENPFNQAGNVRFDSTREEIEEQRRRVKEETEKRLA